MKESILAIPRSSRTRPVSETFQAAAWRAPTSPRFDSRPANDVAPCAETAEREDIDGVTGAAVIPRWFIAIAGGLIVAMLAVFAAHAMTP